MDFIRASRRRKLRNNTSSHMTSEIGGDGHDSNEYWLFLEALARAFAQLADQGESDWLESALSFASKNADELGLEAMEQKLTEMSDDNVGRHQKRQCLREVSVALTRKGHINKSPSGLALRLDFLCNLLELDDVNRAVFHAAARCGAMPLWGRLIADICGRRYDDKSRLIAALANLNIADARRALAAKGLLRSKGLFQDRSDCDDLELSTLIRAFLNNSVTAEDDMLRVLMPSLGSTTLTPQDYEHMTKHVSSAEQLFKHALKTGEKANLLIYGPPGTGKTELARLLADQLGVMAVSIGEADDDGEEPSRRERLLHLILSRKMLERRGGAILVIDEAEDLFVSGIEQRGSKVWLNKLVEDGKGPHIWIVNNPGLLGEPVVRRMDLAIRFEMPSAKTRRNIVERLVVREGASLIRDEAGRKQLIADLAEINTTPAILSAAMRTGARVGEDCGSVVNFARDLAEASGRMAIGAYEASETLFDPALSVANCDLVALADRLVGSPRNWSLLLSGASGTGKSAFARYIANRAGLDIVCKSGSELLGMYVGETEKLIAAAFNAAEREKSILLIDEADSFLTNRDMAKQAWEISMTNEMLRHMERGRVRFIATSNRANTLDPASARRFVLHAEFATLNAQRVQRLFELSFNMPAPSSLGRIDGLTPGDFSQVRKHADLLGETNADRLADLLVATVNARDGNKERIGF